MTQVELAKQSTSTLDFPELPEYKAEWCPIYWEPILLSGERFCAMIAVVGHDGKILVEPVIRKNVHKVLFSKKGEDAANLIQWASELLKDHLSQAGNLKDWRSPISGFDLGKIRTTVSSSVESVFQQVLPLCSSLANIELPERIETAFSKEMSLERWKANIKSGVINSLPRLEKAFNHQFKVKKGARNTQLDFVGHNMAANFSRLVSSSLSRSVKESKAQILDLTTFKDRHDLFSSEEQYKLMVWRPNKSMDFGLSDNQFQNLEEAFLELEGEGDRVGLIVTGYTNPDEAVQDICQLEVAV